MKIQSFWVIDYLKAKGFVRKPPKKDLGYIVMHKGKFKITIPTYDGFQSKTTEDRVLKETAIALGVSLDELKADIIKHCDPYYGQTCVTPCVACENEPKEIKRKRVRSFKIWKYTLEIWA